MREIEKRECVCECVPECVRVRVRGCVEMSALSGCLRGGVGCEFAECGWRTNDPWRETREVAL